MKKFVRTRPLAVAIDADLINSTQNVFWTGSTAVQTVSMALMANASDINIYQNPNAVFNGDSAPKDRKAEKKKAMKEANARKAMARKASKPKKAKPVSDQPAEQPEEKTIPLKPLTLEEAFALIAVTKVHKNVTRQPGVAPHVVQPALVVKTMRRHVSEIGGNLDNTSSLDMLQKHIDLYHDDNDEFVYLDCRSLGKALIAKHKVSQVVLDKMLTILIKNGDFISVNSGSGSSKANNQKSRCFVSALINDGNKSDRDLSILFKLDVKAIIDARPGLLALCEEAEKGEGELDANGQAIFEEILKEIFTKTAMSEQKFDPSNYESVCAAYRRATNGGEKKKPGSPDSILGSLTGFSSATKMKPDDRLKTVKRLRTLIEIDKKITLDNEMKFLGSTRDTIGVMYSTFMQACLARKFPAIKGVSGEWQNAMFKAGMQTLCPFYRKSQIALAERKRNLETYADKSGVVWAGELDIRIPLEPVVKQAVSAWEAKIAEKAKLKQVLLSKRSVTSIHLFLDVYEAYLSGDEEVVAAIAQVIEKDKEKNKDKEDAKVLSPVQACVRHAQSEAYSFKDAPFVEHLGMAIDGWYDKSKRDAIMAVVKYGQCAGVFRKVFSARIPKVGEIRSTPHMGATSQPKINWDLPPSLRAKKGTKKTDEETKREAINKLIKALSEGMTSGTFMGWDKVGAVVTIPFKVKNSDISQFITGISGPQTTNTKKRKPQIDRTAQVQSIAWTFGVRQPKAFHQHEQPFASVSVTFKDTTNKLPSMKDLPGKLSVAADNGVRNPMVFSDVRFVSATQVASMSEAVKVMEAAPKDISVLTFIAEEKKKKFVVVGKIEDMGYRDLSYEKIFMYIPVPAEKSLVEFYKTLPPSDTYKQPDNVSRLQCIVDICFGIKRLGYANPKNPDMVKDKLEEARNAIWPLVHGFDKWGHPVVYHNNQSMGNLSYERLSVQAEIVNTYKSVKHLYLNLNLPVPQDLQANLDNFQKQLISRRAERFRQTVGYPRRIVESRIGTSKEVAMMAMEFLGFIFSHELGSRYNKMHCDWLAPRLTKEWPGVGQDLRIPMRMSNPAYSSRTNWFNGERQLFFTEVDKIRNKDSFMRSMFAKDSDARYKPYREWWSAAAGSTDKKTVQQYMESLPGTTMVAALFGDQVDISTIGMTHRDTVGSVNVNIESICKNFSAVFIPCTMRGDEALVTELVAKADADRAAAKKKKDEEAPKYQA